MSKTVLITGAYGFIGRYVAREYKKNGYSVIGMGHGEWSQVEYQQWGIDFWHACDITLENLILYGNNPDYIVHCAGGASVGFSVKNPMLDFKRSVCTMQYILEYIRMYSMHTKLIYTSSAAVYGKVDVFPIKEDTSLNPISPYGVHKKMAEELCQLYCKQYGMEAIIVRLFSVYGNGLKKQLLWDACNKIKNGENIFWGTGEEKRDWIHIMDVAKLLYRAKKEINQECPIVNGASGKKVSIKEVLNCLFFFFETSLTPKFGGQIDIGNPKEYFADIGKISKWNWKTEIDLETGIKSYVEWYKNNEKN